MDVFDEGDIISDVDLVKLMIWLIDSEQYSSLNLSWPKHTDRRISVLLCFVMWLKSYVTCSSSVQVVHSLGVRTHQGVPRWILVVTRWFNGWERGRNSYTKCSLCFLTFLLVFAWNTGYFLLFFFYLTLKVFQWFDGLTFLMWSSNKCPVCINMEQQINRTSQRWGVSIVTSCIKGGTLWTPRSHFAHLTHALFEKSKKLLTWRHSRTSMLPPCCCSTVAATRIFVFLSVSDHTEIPPPPDKVAPPPKLLIQEEICSEICQSKERFTQSLGGLSEVPPPSPFYTNSCCCQAPPEHTGELQHFLFPLIGRFL